jgi:signal transduction histidine kinase
LGNILESNERLNETVDNLLLLSRVEAIRPGEQQTIFIVADLVDEVLALLDVVIEERHITVIEEGESVGRVGVNANRSLLRAAILNVLHNALKFSPNGSNLRISYVRSEDPAPRLRIAFQDQGPGIAAGEHRQVFERFFTSRGRATASQSGTGLGLSIAKLVVDRIGGAIWFDEEIGHGARCIICLPIS